MINATDFMKMTPEQQKALDPIECLASALAAIAVQLDEARSVKDAGMLLHAISVTLEIADQLEMIGAKMAAKIVGAALKATLAEHGELPKEVADKMRAHGIELAELPNDEKSSEKDEMEFTLGMPTMKPAKA